MDESEEEIDECTCDEGIEEHYCQYQTEVNHNDDFMCKCCAFCEYNCKEQI